MTTLREAVAQALDSLTKIHPGNMSWETGDAWLDAVQILREALAQPEREPLTDDLYNELLFAVGNKYPGETRHETALRYIKQAETGSNESAKTAHGIGCQE